MKLADQIALWTPLLIGLAMTVVTLAVHATAGISTISIIQRQFLRGRAGVRVSLDLPLIAMAVFVFMCAHLIETGLWALVLLALGEFHSFANAFYHSAVNYTTLGYGDILMAPRWRLLGPLESMDGMLMFGVSTAVLFNVILRLGQLRSRGSGSWIDSDRPPRAAEPHRTSAIRERK